ncbi:MAG: peptide-methionine (S)-S-oxide reductase [Desulfuromonas sp.]|nr:MAG: peptide-methionine (S)-S-oxide reductase [Desulfuromonas sp.]
MRSEKQVLERAIFSGGCFWCMEPPFSKIDGVKSVRVGYTGGTTENPSYQMVCSGETGHAEAVEVTFDPTRVTYAELVEVFWRTHDPTDAGGSFHDRGSQYRSGIFYLNDGQRQVAEASKRVLESSGRFSRQIATEVSQAGLFYPAEPDHQGYWKKYPAHYQSYRQGSGRDRFFKAVWSKKE